MLIFLNAAMLHGLSYTTQRIVRTPSNFHGHDRTLNNYIIFPLPTDSAHSTATMVSSLLFSLRVVTFVTKSACSGAILAVGLASGRPGIAFAVGEFLLPTLAFFRAPLHGTILAHVRLAHKHVKSVLSCAFSGLDDILDGRGSHKRQKKPHNLHFHVSSSSKYRCPVRDGL